MDKKPCQLGNSWYKDSIKYDEFTNKGQTGDILLFSNNAET